MGCRSSDLAPRLLVRYTVRLRVIMTKEHRLETINVAEAKSRLSELLSRVLAGERFTIQRRERPVAVLIGAAELQRIERVSQLSGRLAALLGQDADLLTAIERGEVHPAMAAFGLWRNDPELDDLAERIAANREGQAPRPAPEL